MFLQTWKKPKE